MKAELASYFGVVVGTSDESPDDRSASDKVLCSLRLFWSENLINASKDFFAQPVHSLVD